MMLDKEHSAIGEQYGVRRVYRLRKISDELPDQDKDLDVLEIVRRALLGIHDLLGFTHTMDGQVVGLLSGEEAANSLTYAQVNPVGKRCSTRITSALELAGSRGRAIADPKFLESGNQGLPSGRNALRQIRSFSPGPTGQRNFRFPHTPGLPYRRPAADAGLGPCLATKTSSCSEKNGSSSSRNTRTAAAGVERSGAEKISSWIPCSTGNLPSQNDLADTYKR